MDIEIQDDGSVWIVSPRTMTGRNWLDDHVDRFASYQPYWPTVVVENRYMAELLDGMIADGLSVAPPAPDPPERG